MKNTKIKLIFGFVFVLIAVLLLASCKQEKTCAIGANKAKIELSMGDTFDLSELGLSFQTSKVEDGFVPTYIYTIEDNTIAEIQDNKIKALTGGTTTLTITVADYKGSATVTVFVNGISFECNEDLIKGQTVELVASVGTLTDPVSFSSSDNSIISIENNTLSALKEGTATVTMTCGNSTYSKTIKVNKKTDKATVSYTSDYNEKVYLNWNKDVNDYITTGISVIDPIFGDITDKYSLEGTVDNQTYGTYDVKLVYDDGTGTNIEIERKVEVVWNYSVQFIGHAGSYFGVANTEQAFLYAARDLHYQALECDLKRTKDGVFVMCHDDTFGGQTIANLTYAELSKVTASVTRNSGYPNQYGLVKNGGQYSSNICTLDRYLEICKEYNCTAIIELKGAIGITQSDQSGMQALMDQIEKDDMLDNVVFLGSSYNCLAWTRSNGYSQVPCQYLVNSLDSQTVLDRCNTYDFDISTNVTNDPAYANSEEWIAKYKEAGHKVSVWTFTQYVDYSTVQEWIDKGVDYVTCDWHEMYKFNLPEYTTDYQEVVKHTVTFYDSDGTLIKKATVVDGKTAAGPVEPTKVGYTFTGWDKDITNVTSDLDVVATYEAITYTISFDRNLYVEEVTTWANKEDFVNDLYTDMYNWFITSGESSSVSGVTVSDATVTITRNSQTATFSNASELRAVDIYVFEKTVSNFIYKPLTARNSDGTATMDDDENYFLNSSKYKAKYQELDQVIYETCNVNYSSYNKLYTPTSAGKIQIFFRFHQWTKGTAISTLDKYFPADSTCLISKHIVSDDPSLTCTMPDKITYTVEDQITFPSPTNANLTFLGWYTTKDCTGTKVTHISKGTTKNMTLYAKWQTA